MNPLAFVYKTMRFIKNRVHTLGSNVLTLFLFIVNGVEYQNFLTHGIPFIHMNNQALFRIGKNFKLNNNHPSNPIGRQGGCSFVVRPNAKLIIGNNVGMSSTSIVCANEIIIEDNVTIGGNTCIYDTDFHSLDAIKRMDKKLDITSANTKAILIRKNAFIGAHCIILKGVTIGENTIVGTGSVVAKNLPANQVWAGNPAIFIRYNS